LDSNGDGLIDPSYGHGTHVAGLITLASPQAKILPLRCFSAEGDGDAFAIAKAVRYALEAGAGVINMSFGLPYRSRIVDFALDQAAQAGVLLVASAGNQALSDPGPFPARKSAVLAVAATDAQDQLADFSNFGSFIEISAPGVGLYSAYPQGGYAIWSGTSMSAPLVSGVLAELLRIEPSAAAAEAALLTGAMPIDAINPGYEGALGAGRIDALAAVELALGWSGSTPSLKLDGTLEAPRLSVIQSGPDLAADLYFGYLDSGGQFRSLGPSGFEEGLFASLSGVVLPSGFAVARVPLIAFPPDAGVGYVALTPRGSLELLAVSLLQR
jgi:subtilisin family serine protease